MSEAEDIFYLSAERLGKQYRREWIFQNFSQTFRQGRSYAVTGGNGSGKTTLLKTLSGISPASEGGVVYHFRGKRVEEEDVFRLVAWAAPYIELIEEFTLTEMLEFYAKLKGLSVENAQLLDWLSFPTATRQRFIKHFSSGMKQKLKLALAFGSRSPLLLLDEPTTNLDAENARWYFSLVNQIRLNRVVIIASNQPTEYDFCEEIISLKDFKPSPFGSFPKITFLGT